MVRARLSWLNDWLSPTIRRHGLTSSWFFPAGPRQLAGVIAKLDRLGNGIQGKTAKAGINSRVRLVDVANGEEKSVMLVLPADARPAEGRVSVLSPLGSALLASRAGKTVKVTLLGADYRFRVLDVVANTAEEEAEPEAAQVSSA